MQQNSVNSHLQLKLQIAIQIRQFSMNSNTQNMLQGSPNFKQPNQSSQTNSPNRNKETKYRCPSCHEHSHILCYACCFQFACQKCYNASHFLTCGRQFNKFIINLTSSDENITLSKRNTKKTIPSQKCKRCDQTTDTFEYCEQCKINMCPGCSEVIHSKGKFCQHKRTKPHQELQKKKNNSTVMTQHFEKQGSFVKKSQKQNLENYQHASKTRERISKPIGTPMKKNKSTVRPLTSNHEMSTNQRQNALKSTLLSFRDNSIIKPGHYHHSSAIFSSVLIPIEPKGLICSTHNKTRNILTQNLDIVCNDCFQEIKTSTVKLKTIEVNNWLQNQNNLKDLSLSVSSILQELQLKSNDLQLQFDRFKQIISQEYTRKQEMLQNRYKANLASMQKWENIYKQSISAIICQSKVILDCQKVPIILQSSETYQTNQIKLEAQKMYKIRCLLKFEEINKLKKQYYNQQEQFQFKINDVTHEQFQDLLKNVSFIRKKNQLDGLFQKSISKISQSNQLRQSRLSSSNMTTNQKNLQRDNSSIKSNYDLSNGPNNARRSVSKSVVKEDLVKDISQRILFPNEGMADMKNRLLQNAKSQISKSSQYFFENVPDNRGKSNFNKKEKNDKVEKQNFAKEVKYINLDYFLTQKIQKRTMELQKTNNANILAVMAQQKSAKQENNAQTAETVSERQLVNRQGGIMDTKMINSICINQSFTNKIAPTSISNCASSVNSSVYNQKNKRKSDYLQMRDRLRKPNTIHKINK